MKTWGAIKHSENFDFLGEVFLDHSSPLDWAHNYTLSKYYLRKRQHNEHHFRSYVYSKLHATPKELTIFKKDIVKEENRFKPTLENM